MEALSLQEDGAQLFRAALDEPALHRIESALADLPPDCAGTRLHNRPAFAQLLGAREAVGRVAASALGQSCFPVRAILFDKTPATNWALGWHQDRTIAVRHHREAPGFGPWTCKQGLLHVAPPPGILAAMVTLRVHLDDVPSINAPLMVARGSHRLGAVVERDIDTIIEQSEIIECLAERGDVWLYATLVLHASAAAIAPDRRRVLQVDYAAQLLPNGLEWLGI